MALLAARSPRLRQALRDAGKAGHAYLVIDGTLIRIDRVAADRPFYSGKHRKHGMNLQVIASPDGDIVWVSGPLPGAVHDLTAARIWGIVGELAASGLVVLGDKGYLGEDHIRAPYPGRDKPASQKEANRADARLRALVSVPVPSSSPGASCVSSAAAPGAPGSWPRRSTFCRPARVEDEEDSLMLTGRCRSFRPSLGAWSPTECPSCEYNSVIGQANADFAQARVEAADYAEDVNQIRSLQPQ